jgi:hypothetical protein
VTLGLYASSFIPNTERYKEISLRSDRAQDPYSEAQFFPAIDEVAQRSKSVSSWESEVAISVDVNPDVNNPAPLTPK